MIQADVTGIVLDRQKKKQNTKTDKRTTTNRPNNQYFYVISIKLIKYESTTTATPAPTTYRFA
jgi:hypothetical protein